MNEQTPAIEPVEATEVPEVAEPADIAAPTGELDPVEAIVPSEPARRNVFRRVARTRMPQDQGRRQAEVMTAAWNRLRDTSQVKAFLNEADESLGGTPLEVAMASDEGLAKVVAHLSAGSAPA